MHDAGSGNKNQLDEKRKKMQSMTVVLIAESVVFVLLNMPNEIIRIPYVIKHVVRRMVSIQCFCHDPGSLLAGVLRGVVKLPDVHGGRGKV
jgi:hypothetical protein